MKQLTLALHNYHDVHGSFPPAAVYDKNGRTMHSWRVLILPHIEEAALYKAYDFSEAWDGPNNRKLADKMPDAFACPGCRHCAEKGFCPHGKQLARGPNYFAVVGPSTAWPANGSTKLGDLADGSSQTVMLIEASGVDLNWMEPRDLTLQEAVEMVSDAGSQGHIGFHDTLFTAEYRDDGRHFGWGDGHVEYQTGQISPDEARSLFTIAGGEPSPVAFKSRRFGPALQIVKWGKIYSFGLFAALALMPVYRVVRKRKATVENC